MAMELAQVRGDLEKANKERDDAMAQMATMKRALEAKCGAKAAAVAADKAKLAASKLAEERAQAQVKNEQQAARSEAQKANTAMSTARAAVAAKEKAKAALTDAQKQLTAAKANEKAVTTQANTVRDKAKKLAEGGGGDSEVKAAYAEASSMYAKVMDAKMRREVTQKRVQELSASATSASDKASKELLGAKDYTKDA